MKNRIIIRGTGKAIRFDDTGNSEVHQLAIPIRFGAIIELVGMLKHEGNPRSCLTGNATVRIPESGGLFIEW